MQIKHVCNLSMMNNGGIVCLSLPLILRFYRLEPETLRRGLPGRNVRPDGGVLSASGRFGIWVFHQWDIKVIHGQFPHL